MEHPNNREISKVIDIQDFRARKDEDRRRQFERFHLSKEVMAFAVLDDGSEIKIAIIEVSRAGLSFQVSMASGLVTERDMPNLFSIRFFLTSNSYIKIPVSVANESVTETSLRFGCKIDETARAYEAYCAWIDFMTIYGKHAKRIQSGPEAA
jgi:hypothetical protein